MIRLFLVSMYIIKLVFLFVFAMVGVAFALGQELTERLLSCLSLLGGMCFMFET